MRYQIRKPDYAGRAEHGNAPDIVIASTTLIADAVQVRDAHFAEGTFIWDCESGRRLD